MERAPLFSIPVADLDYGERDLDEEIPVAWLDTALAGSEATPAGTPGRVEVTVSKSGREVMVRGYASAAVTLPCARTLEPARYDLRADIFLLLGPPSTNAPGGGPRSPGRRGKGENEKGSPRKVAAPRPASGDKGRGPRKGEASGLPGRGRKRAEEPAGHEPDAELEAAQDTHDGERVVLDPFVREALLLELPMFPLREDLRSEETPAIDGPPIGPRESDRVSAAPVDPRLAPLAALKSRLREKKE
jgi:uncharacterized protein